MNKLFWLAFVPTFLLLTDAKGTSRTKQHDFVSMGSMDDLSQSATLLENISISRLNISLEKLVEKQMNVKPIAQSKVQHIQQIQIQPPSSTNSQVDSELYKKAVEALRKIAPNLQTCTLIGSYMFKPANENRPDSIKEEIVFIRNYLKTVIGAFKSQNVTVEDVRFVVGMIVPEKTQAQIDFGRQIRTTFGYQPTPDELESKTVGIIVQFNKTTCYLGIGINPSKQEDGWMSPTSIISVGRSKFQEQVILTNFKKEWYSRILDIVDTEPSSVMHAKHRVNDLSKHRSLLVKSASLDDPHVHAVGRTNSLPRRLFMSQTNMDTEQKPPQLQLEDFFDKHIDSIQGNNPRMLEGRVERLGLKVTVQNRTNITSSQMYKTAVSNLKKLVPNLHEVSLYGGYVYQPRKPTRDSVKNEIEYLAQNIRTWIEAFNEVGIKVTEIRFIGTFVVSDKIRETSQYKEALQKSFHYTATKTEIDQAAIRMRLEFNGVPCRVGIHFRNDENSQAFCPPPTSVDTKTERYEQFNYFCAAEKRPMHRWYKSVWSDQQFSW